MDRPRLEIGLRMLLAGGALVALAGWAGDTFVTALLPLLCRELGLLDDHFRILACQLVRQGADSVIRLDVALARPVLVDGRVVFPDPRGVATVTTLAGHVTQPAVLFAAVLAVWPAPTAAAFPRRALVGLPILFAVLMADVPFVLLAELWALLGGDSAGFSLLQAWRSFLLEGGRLALGLAAGAAAVALAGRRAAAPSERLNGRRVPATACHPPSERT